MREIILLTGGSGMVGKNIMHLNSISNNSYTILTPSSQELDLRDYEGVLKYIQSNNVDCIIHAAGHVGGIHANIKNPVKFLLYNIDIGRNIIMAAYHSGIYKFINLGSSCMYPRDVSNPIKEEMILRGELEPTNEGYALAKIMAARLCEYINIENTAFHYKTIIPCNLYGRFDNFDIKRSHLIPSIIYKTFDAIRNNKKEILIWGDGRARREVMNAEDLADAIMFSLRNYETMPNVMNIGVGEDYMIKEYYKMISEILDYHGGFKYDKSKPVGMKQRLVSVKKQTKFGWSPKIALEDGLASTCNFYKERYL